MNTNEFKTTASFLIPILQAAESRGLEIDHILNMDQQNMHSIATPGNFICIEKLDGLINQIIDQEHDPDFIIDIAKNIQPVTFLGLGYVMMSANNIKESLQYQIEYHRLISNFTDLKLHEDDESLYLTYKTVVNPDTGYAISTYSELSFIAVLIQLLRMIMNHKFSPTKISFKSTDAMKVTEKYQQFINCELDFCGDETVIEFNKQQCHKPLYTANPSFLQTHKVILDRQISMADKLDIVSRVEEQIRNILPHGELSQSSIANNLHLSLRNLQRKLNVRGTNYRDLLENTRKDLAFKYIHEPDLSLGEISYLLGFSTHSNFNRAFKRWSELSPNLFRKQNLCQQFMTA